jgi:Domain of unknown function (DUF4369)
MQKQSLGLVAGLLGAFLAFLTLGGSVGCTSILGNFEVSDGGGSEGGGGDAKLDAADATPDAPKGPFTVGGHVAGLMGSGLVLHDNGGDALSVSSSGPFTFATELSNGAAYSVSVATQPMGPKQNCVVLKGKGTVDGANVTNVDIVCTTETFTISGKVSHLAKGDSVILENNGLDDVTVDANGAFSFKLKVPDQGSYAVTVKTQPSVSTDTCYVSATGTGTISGADVTNVVVSCSDCGRFTTGVTATSWTTVEVDPFGTGLFMTDYLPPGMSSDPSFYMFQGNTTSSSSFNGSSDAYTSLAPAPVNFLSYQNAVWYQDAVFTMQGANLLRYDISLGTWTIPFGTLTFTGLTSTETAVDNVGNLWGFQSESILNEYNIAAGTVTPVTLPTPLSGGAQEPRIVYDGCSGLLYLNDFLTTAFYSYDPATNTQTMLSPLPSSNVFQDGFCSDRSGHIFEIDNGANPYQYNVATDTWVALPAGPTGNNNSACGVGADGNLYATDPNVSTMMYQIPIQ